MSDTLKNKLIEEIKSLNYSPRLVIIQVGENEEIDELILKKMNLAKELGVSAVHKKYEDRFVQSKLIEDIKDLGPWVDGIFVQTPLDEVYDTKKILDSIPEDKVIDKDVNHGDEYLFNLFENLIKNIKK